MNYLNRIVKSFRTLPLLFTVVLIGVVVSLWQIQLKRERSFEKQLVLGQTKKIEDNILETLNQTSSALQRFAWRVEYLGVRDEGFLNLDARAYLSQLPILKRIGITNSQAKVIWSYPAAINSQVKGFDESTDALRLEALQEARQTHKPSLSRSVELRSGSAGFLLPVALFRKGEFAGFLYATVQGDQLFHSFIQSPDFKISLRESDKTFFESNQVKATASEYASISSFKMGRSEWEVEVIPTQEFIERNGSAVPTLVLLFGMFITLICGKFVYSLYQSHGVLSDRVQEKTRELKSVLKHVPFAFWALDADRKFLFREGVGMTALGLKSTDMVGKSIYDIYAGLPHVIEAVERAYTGEAFEVVMQIAGRWFNVAFAPTLDANKKLTGITGITFDVTDRKVIEDEKLRLQVNARAALESSELKSEFLANMSHEIRTPMNGVIGMTNLLQKTQLTAEQQDFVESIRISSDGLLTIINDILDFSKIEAGKLELEFVDFGQNHLISGIEKTFIHAVRSKGLELSVISPEFKNSLKGDSSRVRQVLNNLVSNALKFTQAGKIEIRVKVLHESSKDVKLRYEVRDTGIGIPEKSLHRMFSAFSQGDSSTSRKYGGTGLGLSISKRLVEMMGGQIGVLSEEGRGSTFWFELSFSKGGLISAQVPKEAANQREKVANLFKAARILVAEDNQINQKVISNTLKLLGCHTVQLVANGEEAIDALRDGKYDLVLMDCQMPELDGYETTTLIRQSKTLEQRNVPIVAMTANAMKGDRDKCLAIGMNDYVAKPIDEKKLIMVLKKFLAHDNGQREILPRVPIDKTAIEKLAQIQLDGEPDIVVELISMFITTAPERIAQMDELLEKSDVEVCAKVAHALKSSSRSLGAEAMAKICQQLEDCGADSPVSNVHELLVALKSEYATAANELHEIARSRANIQILAS